MRRFQFVAFALCAVFSTAVTIFSACSQDPNGCQATCSGGSSSGHSTSGSSMTGAGGAHCANIYVPDGYCDDCLHQSCCAEIAACGALDSCIACFLDGGTPKDPPCTDSLPQLNP